MRTRFVASRVLWRASFLAALLPAATGCTEALPPDEAAASAVITRAAPAPTSDEGESRAARNFSAFALNALLVPLLDPELRSPNRWADPSFTLACLDASVTIDGKQLEIGAPVPGRFTVRWRLDRCTPLGPNLELSGQVTLQVEADGTGHVARVVPEDLTARSAEGVDRITRAFTARLAAPFDTRSPRTASVAPRSRGG